MTDFPDLPDFLRAEVSSTCAAPEPQIGVKTIRRREKRQRFDLPRNMDATSWALQRQIERDKAERQKARFAALRERRK